MSYNRLFCITSAFRIALAFINKGKTFKARKAELLELLTGIGNSSSAKKLSTPKMCFLSWLILEWMGCF